MAKEPITKDMDVRVEYYKFLNDQYDGDVHEGDSLNLHNLMKLAVKCEGTSLTALAKLKTPPIKGLAHKLNETSRHNFLTEDITWLQNWLKTTLKQDKYTLLPKENIDLDDLFATRYSEGQVIPNANHVKKLYESRSQYINSTAAGLIYFVARCEGITNKALANKKEPPIEYFSHKLSLANNVRVQFTADDVVFLHDYLVTALEDDKYAKLEEHEKPTPEHIKELLFGQMARRLDPSTVAFGGASKTIIEAQERNHP